MNPRVLEAIIRQINSELSASYAYLAMSAYCESQKFTGAARWLRVQSQEENMHAMKLFDFVLARDCTIQLLAIDRPKSYFGSVAEVFERALEQEKEVSRQIDALYDTKGEREVVLDLAEVLPLASNPRTKFQIHVGADDELDMIHARRVSALPGVHLVVHELGGHRLVKTLRDRGMLQK